ncbi:MAG: hypothetical protein PW792_16665 [Acidobacteriaceae bacterium]|nr:hypothetical protein [Acidobacteriaceae bacterium]
MAAKQEVLTIPAGEFKAKCLALLDQVNNGSLKVIVTKRGKVVAEVSQPPQPEEKPFVSIFGRSPNGKVLGDIITPLDEWADPLESGSASPERRSAGERTSTRHALLDLGSTQLAKRIEEADHRRD